MKPVLDINTHEKKYVESDINVKYRLGVSAQAQYFHSFILPSLSLSVSLSVNLVRSVDLMMGQSLQQGMVMQTQSIEE